MLAARPDRGDPLRPAARGRDAAVPGELGEPGAVDEPAQHGLLRSYQGLQAYLTPGHQIDR